MLAEQLRKTSYRRVGTLNLEPFDGGVRKGLFGVARSCDSVAARWASDIGRLAAQSSMQQLLCPLLCTLKVHKIQVVSRCIHASAQSILNAVGGALNLMLEPLLSRLSFLRRSPEDISRQLMDIFVEKGPIFLKFDVKNFDLEGGS